MQHIWVTEVIVLWSRDKGKRLSYLLFLRQYGLVPPLAIPPLDPTIQRHFMLRDSYIFTVFTVAHPHVTP